MSSLIVKVILAIFKGASARRDNIYFSTVERILSGRTHLQHLRSSDGYRVPICITTQSFAEVGFFFRWNNNLRMGPCQICIKFHHGRSVLSVLPAAPRIQPPLSMQPTHHGFRSGPRWPRMFQRNRGPNLDLSWPRAGKIKAIVHTSRVVRVILALWPC